MVFLTPAQFLQLGKKCFRCEKPATYFDKFDENAPAYCDEHFPYRGEVALDELAKQAQELDMGY